MLLGILVPSAYLASACWQCSYFSGYFANTSMDPSLPTIKTQVLDEWEKLAGQSVESPTGLMASKQRAWESLVVEGAWFTSGCSHLCPHNCSHCGGRMNEDGLHGLSCHRCVWRILHCSQLSTIIKDSLVSANIPSVLEPQGLSWSDGKRPDG